MASFKDLKKSSASRLTELKAKLEEQNKTGGNNEPDSRFWKPTVSEEGNGFAIIRFLPEAHDFDLPWAKYWDHGFQGPGGWYIEKSITTIGKKDPVSEMNSRLWATGLQTDKQIVQGINGKNATKRRLHYVANILVISDPKAPQNEGKVFMYDFGKKIFDKIEYAMSPNPETDPDKVGFNPVDFWTGANFRLKIRKVEGQRNYDTSEFDAPSALFDGDDKKIEAVWKQQYNLAEFVDPTKFKTEEELKTRLVKVFGDFVGSGIVVVEGGVKASATQEPSRAAPAAKEKAAPQQKTLAVSDSEDDDAEFFRKAALGQV